MKFLHLSDIHFGSYLDSGYGWEKDRDTEKENNLLAILEEARKEHIDLILITGGLFAHTPVDSEMKKAADIFGAFMEIEVVIIAGGSDALSFSSPANSFIWPENLHYVLGEGVSPIILNRINTEVYAASVLDGVTSLPEDFCKKASSRGESEEIKLAMIRLDEVNEPDLAEKLKDFVGSEFSYVALGGLKKYTEIIPDFIYSSGSLEPEDAAKMGSFGLIKGEISLETGKLENICFKEASSLSYVTLNVKINVKATMEEIEDSIRAAIQRRGKNNIYVINIFGKRNPLTHLDFGNLRENYRILKFVDATEPEYDYKKLFMEHPQDMIGFFIRNVSSSKEHMSELEKKAMYYGIDALISTMEEN